MQSVNWIQGQLGLLHIMQQQSCSKKKTMKMQKRVDRIEQAIQVFFTVTLPLPGLDAFHICHHLQTKILQDLANRIDDVEGLDLTDKGDEVVGPGLCMITHSSEDENSAGSDDDEDSEFHCGNAEEDSSTDIDNDDAHGSDDDDEEDHESEQDCSTQHENNDPPVSRKRKLQDADAASL